MYDENESRAVTRMVETQRELRGHDFLPPAEELSAVPDAYATEETPTSLKTIHLHYFTTNADWWIAEAWQEEQESENDRPQWMAFGYVRFAHMPQDAEWGYISLNDLESLPDNATSGPRMPTIIERDLNFTPALAHECIPGIPTPASDHGYPYVLAWARATSYLSERQLDDLCKQAAGAEAPAGSYEVRDGVWSVVDDAPAEVRSILNVEDQAEADDA